MVRAAVLIFMCLAGVLTASGLPKVRGNVVLSDRNSATFFELQRDGQVLLHDHYLRELDGATNFEHRLVSVNAKDRTWSWREGYLPILEIGGDVELFAKGDGLFIRSGDKFTVWPEGRNVDKATFLSARESIVEYWRKWFAAGLQLPYVDKRTENACKASLVQALCMFAGRHPVYGAGNYRTFIHDSFPPATLAMCETLIQFGHPEEAADVLVYYLDRFLLADGEIDYYGPSLAEYGGFMWVSSMVMDAVPARAAEVAGKMRPLVKAVLRRFNYQGPGGRIGPHKLLSGSPEADMKDAKDEYYHNNCQVLLGLKMIATRYHDVGDVFFAADVRKYARMLERMIDSAYSAKRAALGGVPYSEGQTMLYDDIQSEMNSTYANYRYYPELLESGWLSAEDAEWVVKYREAHNGDYHGMTLFSPPGWGPRTDNWPIASYARGLLEYGMRDRFEKVLRGMLDDYLSDDTFTAYEQVYTKGDPRRPAAPACVPAQLAFPRMLAWSFKYTPWKTSVRLVTNMAGRAVAPQIAGVTDKDPISYRTGEIMVFTLTALGGSRVRWVRTGDDGREEKGEAKTDAPIVVETSLDRPGFVRLVAELVDASGRRLARFDGGAGADVDKIRPDNPEPEDFDAFWARHRATLAKVPMDGAECREVASGREDVKLYEVSVPCVGPRPATGFLSVPAKPGKYPALIRFHGYNASWGTGARTTPKSKSLRSDKIVLSLSAHGYEFNREESYYKKLRKSCGSNGYDYAFDPVQNSDPEQAYFCGMTYRVMRGLEYLKSRPEWDGKNLAAEGGSQGGLQSIWAAALDHDVTECRPFIPWCCNIGGPAAGRARGNWHIPWVPALGYYDAANMARRIPATCRTTVTWAGLGDYTCPPSGVAAFYNNLSCPKKITWVQGATHSFYPSGAKTFSLSADASR